MKAIVVDQLGSIDNGRLAEVPDPLPGAGQALIEVRAVPVNYVDIVTITGNYQFKPKLPYTPGKGPAGVVRAVGLGVTQVKPGDRVLAMAEHGGYAELALADSAQCYSLPDGLDFVPAAAMSLAFDTAWVALHDRARMVAGDRVLVLGSTGAVGNAAVQLAKAAGCQVLAAVATAEKFAGPAAVGADAMIDLSRPGLGDSLRAQVQAATGGHGADIVIDALGGDIFDAAIRAVAWRGRVVIVGFASGRIPTLKMNYLLLKNIEVSGLQISDYRKRMPGLLERCWREVFAAVAAGTVFPPRCETLPLAHYAEGMRRIAERRAAARIVLVPHP